MINVKKRGNIWLLSFLDIYDRVRNVNLIVILYKHTINYYSVFLHLVPNHEKLTKKRISLTLRSILNRVLRLIKIIRVHFEDCVFPCWILLSLTEFDEPFTRDFWPLSQSLATLLLKATHGWIVVCNQLLYLYRCTSSSPTISNTLANVMT